MASLSASQTIVSEQDDMVRQLKEYQRREEERQELENKRQRAINYINEQTVLKRVPQQIPLLEILENFEFNKYDDAERLYRLPVYQRDSLPPSDWKEELVLSILFGKSIGAIHISEHFYGENNTYYDIEDGRTRITATKMYHENLFSITIGGDKDKFCFKDLPEGLQSKFTNYIISCICIKKNNNEIEDSDYKLALRDNFTKLQEGQQLKHYDLYWAWDNLEDGTSGSPLVVFTISVFKKGELALLAKLLSGTKSMNRRDDAARKSITRAVSLVACAWKGNDGNNYSKEDYNGKRDIINETIDDNEKKNITKKLQGIQYIIEESTKKYKRQKNESLRDFVRNKFTATMMEDFGPDGEMSEYNKLKWVELITETRIKKIEKVDFLDKEVYVELTKAAKQGNCNHAEIIDRHKAINDWWNTYNHST